MTNICMNSPTKNTHYDFMLQALALSKKALPECRPNPPVACLLVKQDMDGTRIVGQGFTQAIGNHHAEVQAMASYKGSLESVIAYVTLEPCSFEGRTPSCAKMLANSGIKQVRVAMLDPDPRNNGKGIAILETAGIKVEIGVAGEAVSCFLSPYLGQS